MVLPWTLSRLALCYNLKIWLEWQKHLRQVQEEEEEGAFHKLLPANKANHNHGNHLRIFIGVHVQSKCERS